MPYLQECRRRGVGGLSTSEIKDMLSKWSEKVFLGEWDWSQGWSKAHLLWGLVRLMRSATDPTLALVPIDVVSRKMVCDS